MVYLPNRKDLLGLFHLFISLNPFSLIKEFKEKKSLVIFINICFVFVNIVCQCVRHRCFIACCSPAATRAKRVKAILTRITLVPCHAASTRAPSLFIALQTHRTWQRGRINWAGRKKLREVSEEDPGFFFVFFLMKLLVAQKRYE